MASKLLTQIIMIFFSVVKTLGKFVKAPQFPFYIEIFSSYYFIILKRSIFLLPPLTRRSGEAF